MAIIHSAYLFDPVKFHRQLREKVVRQNRLDEHAMQDMAKDVVKNASAATRQALRYLRFDPEWLDWPDPEVTHLDKWYVAVLAGTLTLAPSLSNRSPISWRILKQALPLAAWSTQEANRLVEGNPLPSLIESSELVTWLNPIAGALYPYGGWLSLSDAQDLETRLVQSQEKLLKPPKLLENALLEPAALWSESPRELLQRAYADASDMLRAATESRKALLVILD